MNKYYLQNGSESIGPFTIEELKAKGITKNTPVWCEGFPDWVEASSVTELASILNATPPPIKKTAPPPIITKKSSGLNFIQKIALFFLIVIIGLIIFSSLNETKSEDNFETESIDSVVDSSASVVDDSNSEENKKRDARNSITSKVNAQTNEYTVDALGGITNLEITLYNNTDYKIDECEIQVEYLKENGSVFKTEYLIVNNIPAHQDKTLSAPDSNRGLEVNVKINFITSKKLDLCYSSLEDLVAGDIDPYKCK
ncbi:DUF4339 domain-containing protein [Flavobacterium difficile]|uniref:DUF4339 domain-containing protein n=1 Tax=Flavobacterium difficile TaxID=2709659 RepID=A0ABX0I3U3_9FLAO|nr:DUF4339 domain-containing protein [Flavobacterium difficile]NHM01474.1 DUF4339 domain-containing protein [Flavobacterium difficile]